MPIGPGWDPEHTEVIVGALKSKIEKLEENIAKLKDDLHTEMERSKKYIRERDELGEKLSETVEGKARETKACAELSMEVERLTSERADILALEMNHEGAVVRALNRIDAAVKILEQATTLWAAQQALEVLRGSNDATASAGTSGAETGDTPGKAG